MRFGEKATEEEEETGHKEAIQKFTKTYNMNSKSLREMTKKSTRSNKFGNTTPSPSTPSESTCHEIQEQSRNKINSRDANAKPPAQLQNKTPQWYQRPTNLHYQPANLGYQ